MQADTITDEITDSTEQHNQYAIHTSQRNGKNKQLFLTQLTTTNN